MQLHHARNAISMQNSKRQPIIATHATSRMMFTSNNWGWIVRAVTTLMAGPYGSSITIPAQNSIWMVHMRVLTVSRVTKPRPRMASNSHPGALIATARMMYTTGSSAEIASAAITPSRLTRYGSDNAAARTCNQCKTALE